MKLPLLFGFLLITMTHISYSTRLTNDEFKNMWQMLDEIAETLDIPYGSRDSENPEKYPPIRQIPQEDPPFICQNSPNCDQTSSIPPSSSEQPQNDNVPTTPSPKPCECPEPKNPSNNPQNQNCNSPIYVPYPVYRPAPPIPSYPVLNCYFPHLTRTNTGFNRVPSPNINNYPSSSSNDANVQRFKTA